MGRETGDYVLCSQMLIAPLYGTSNIWGPLSVIPFFL